jgi:hypothetical protein
MSVNRIAQRDACLAVLALFVVGGAAAFWLWSGSNENGVISGDRGQVSAESQRARRDTSAPGEQRDDREMTQVSAAGPTTASVSLRLCWKGLDLPIANRAVLVVDQGGGRDWRLTASENGIVEFEASRGSSVEVGCEGVRQSIALSPIPVPYMNSVEFPLPDSMVALRVVGPSRAPVVGAEVAGDPFADILLGVAGDGGVVVIPVDEVPGRIVVGKYGFLPEVLGASSLSPAGVTEVALKPAVELKVGLSGVWDRQLVVGISGAGEKAVFAKPLGQRNRLSWPREGAVVRENEVLMSIPEGGLCVYCSPVGQVGVALYRKPIMAKMDSAVVELYSGSQSVQLHAAPVGLSRQVEIRVLSSAGIAIPNALCEIVGLESRLFVRADSQGVLRLSGDDLRFVRRVRCDRDSEFGEVEVSGGASTSVLQLKPKKPAALMFRGMGGQLVLVDSVSVGGGELNPLPGNRYEVMIPSGSKVRIIYSYAGRDSEIVVTGDTEIELPPSCEIEVAFDGSFSQRFGDIFVVLRNDELEIVEAFSVIDEDRLAATFSVLSGRYDVGIYYYDRNGEKVWLSALSSYDVQGGRAMIEVK